MNTKGQPSACGKLRYMDRAEALVALAILQAKRAGQPGPLERRAYRCAGISGCGGWHLTHRATWNEER